MNNSAVKYPIPSHVLTKDFYDFLEYEGTVYNSKTACFEVIRDIYSEQYNKVFSEDFLSRLEVYEKHHTNYLISEWLDRDFFEVSETRVGDIVVIDTPMNHLGIFVSNGVFFHSRPNMPSRFSLLKKYKVKGYHRHKESIS